MDLGSLGSITLEAVSGSDLDIVNAARVSHGKRKEELDDKDIRLINYLVEHKHFSPFEHTQLRFHVKCPKPIAVQWMRHRTWAYNEISGRYVEFLDEFYEPEQFRKQAAVNKQASEATEWDKEVEETIRAKYQCALNTSYDWYKDLLALGVAKEQARMILPFGFMTEFYATVNLRNFIHWYTLRDHPGAQWEMRCFAKAALQLVEPYFEHSIKAFKEISNVQTDT